MHRPKLFQTKATDRIFTRALQGRSTRSRNRQEEARIRAISEAHMAIVEINSSVHKLSSSKILSHRARCRHPRLLPLSFYPWPTMPAPVALMQGQVGSREATLLKFLSSTRSDRMRNKLRNQPMLQEAKNRRHSSPTSSSSSLDRSMGIINQTSHTIKL